MAKAAGAPAAPVAAAMLQEAAKRPEVVSVRLGDYHIFTVGGVQAVRNGATTRFLAITTRKAMDIEVLYRVAFGQELAQKLYRFINDADHQCPMARSRMASGMSSASSMPPPAP